MYYNNNTITLILKVKFYLASLILAFLFFCFMVVGSNLNPGGGEKIFMGGGCGKKFREGGEKNFVDNNTVEYNTHIIY